MDKTHEKAIVAILVIALAAEACGLYVDLGTKPIASAATTAAVASPTQPATQMLTAQAELPAFYAGFTQNPDIPFLLTHREGESLGTMSAPDGSNIKGVIWSSPDGSSSVVVFSDSNGLPQSAVVGDAVIFYSDYTDETVNLRVVQPDGTRSTVPAKRDLEKLDKIKAFLTTLKPVSYLPIPGLAPDVLEIAKLSLFIAGAATCISTLTATVALPPLITLVAPCAGTLIGGVILYGKMFGLNVAPLEELSYGWNIARCLPGLDLKACLNTILTTFQKLKEMASQKVELAGPDPGTLQLGTFQFNQPPSVTSLRGTINRRSNCRYGPGAPYLYKYGIGNGTPMEVIGRDADGNWLKVQAVGGTNPCWIKGEQVDVQGDVMALPDAYKQTNGLPISPFFPQIVLSSSSSGGHVTVEWPQHAIRSDLNTEEGIEYIVEVWTCVDGKPNFTPIGIGVDQATVAEFDVDSSCGFASHADLIGEDKEGFSPPAPILLP